MTTINIHLTFLTFFWHLIGWAVPYITLCNILKSRLLSSPHLPSRQGNMADTLVKISEDITLNPGYWKGWRIFKMTAVILRPKVLSEIVVRKLRIVNAVVMLIASRSDRLTKLKLLILRRWWQLWKKSTAIKERYRMNWFFVLFCLIVCRARWVNWFTVDVSLHENFLIQLYGCLRLYKRTIGSLFLCFTQLLSAVQLWNYTKTIFRLRLGKYCGIIQCSPRLR